MVFLRLLEQIRVPAADVFFSGITHLGEETLFFVVSLIVLWCFNKTEGYYVITSGLIGTTVNQMLKLIFRIPRPWVLDKNFTIVESARGKATGYSFPSGHTQTSVTTFGELALWNKNRVVRMVCIALCVLVPFSRMYLGVHTPLDVGVSVVVSLLCIFGIYPIIKKSEQNPKYMQGFLLFILAVGIVFVLFVNFYPFSADIDPDNYEEGMKNAYTLLGCAIGLLVSYEVERRYVRFEVGAVWFAQILKVVLGIGLVLGLRMGLKPVLGLLFQQSHVADAIRYFLIVIFAFCIWPLTFPFFRKLGKAKLSASS